MTKVIPIKEFRKNLSHFADIVEDGGIIVVIRHSQPAFKVIPVNQEEKWEELIDFTAGGKKKGIPARKLLTEMKKFMKKHG